MRGQRVKNKALEEKITYATDAAELVKGGYRVGMSGFTGSGYPKLVPQALAERILRAHSMGDKFRITVITGASTSSELDGALAMVDGIELRMPYNSDPIAREKINFGKMEYVDLHLGLVGQYLTSGFLGDLDMAIIEVTGITEDGKLIPSTSVGNNQGFINCAREVVLEVNNYHSLEMEGMHDIHELEMPPNRKPIPIVHPGDRVGRLREELLHPAGQSPVARQAHPPPPRGGLHLAHPVHADRVDEGIADRAPSPAPTRGRVFSIEGLRPG